MAMRLLMVMLSIMAPHTGRFNPRMLGGGKKSQRYPPTTTPMGRAPTTQARKGRFLRRKMR